MTRSAFRLTLMSLAVMSASITAANAQGVLNLYNWGNYTPPELLEKFTAETGIRVTLTDFDSNETALTRVRQGGHGFDIVVPSNNVIPVWIEEGLIQPLDLSVVTNFDNIAPQWVDVPFDPGREYTVPWAWGTTGVIVNTSLYDGDINTSDIFLNPPPALQGRVNVIPEMSDIITMAIYAAGGESCTTDRDVLRTVRDTLVSAKQHWIAMDYGTVDAYAAGDIGAGVYWNGASMRARLQNSDLAYGYPQEGFPVWMDNAAVLTDAPNPEAAMKFINFILEPEHAAMISNYARYSNGILGSEAYLDPEMKGAPEIDVPDALVGAGRFSESCSAEATNIYTQIWTELLQ
ncbi:MAG: extracellular solute-binding protein [Saccharospirillum sp.]|nr:extracellular solute-binding protein [Saccharospirillum sp.]